MVEKEEEESGELDFWGDLFKKTLGNMPPEKRRKFLERYLETTDPKSYLAKTARQILEETSQKN